MVRDYKFCYGASNNYINYNGNRYMKKKSAYDLVQNINVCGYIINFSLLFFTDRIY